MQHAGLKAFQRFEGSALGGGEHGRGHAVPHPVPKAHGVVEAIPLYHAEHRPEALLQGRLRVGIDPGEDGGRHIEAVRQILCEAAAAAAYACARSPCLRDGVQGRHASGPRRRPGPAGSRGPCPVRRAARTRGKQTGEELLHDPAVDDDPAGGTAPLSRVPERPGDHRGDSLVQVGAVEDDDGVLAPSSSWVRSRRREPACWTAVPTAWEPVKLMPATCRCATRASPAATSPWTRLRTPCGSPAS